MSRFARKVDSSHKLVVAAFRAHGCSVEPIQSAKAGLPDLAVGHMGLTHLVEVKPDSHLKAHQTTPAQNRFALSWRGGVVPVVRTIEDVASLVKLWRAQHEVRLRAANALAQSAAVSA